MQQHPIPRNITGFQFKLIGDMTLKQFAYLAVGAVSGYIFFRILPFPGIINVFVGILLAGSGAALAFLPVQGRPLDVWVSSFFKSVFSPTQFVWKKHNTPPDILAKQSKYKGAVSETNEEEKQKMADVDQKLNAYMRKKPQKAHEAVEESEQTRLRRMNSNLGKTEALEHESRETLKHRNTETQKLENTGAQKHESTRTREHESTEARKHENTKTGTYEKVKTQEGGKSAGQQNEGISPLAQFMDEEGSKPAYAPVLKKMRDKSESTKLKQPHPPTDKQPDKKTEKEKEKSEPRTKEQGEDRKDVQVLKGEGAAKRGFPQAPNQPNIISGVALSSEGKPLHGILVTVRDDNKTIVRALKTNQLGQFVSKNPLDNSTYFLEFEDPEGNFSFDIIKIRLHGGIFKPLEVVAQPTQTNSELTGSKEIRKKLFKSENSAYKEKRS